MADLTEKEISENKVKQKKQEIENHIYFNYSLNKQQQDEKWVSSYTTKLKALGVENLEVKVVEMITSFFTGSTLEEILKGVTVQEQKPYFEKLVKVGIRTEWAENCIKEGMTAIDEDREPVYPEFPVF